MQFDKYGTFKASSEDLCDLLYDNPKLNIGSFPVVDPEEYNNSIELLRAIDYIPLKPYTESGIPIEEFDEQNRNNWFMPDSYKHLDIAAWVLEQCETDEELQRCGEELLLYCERNLFDLLKFLKYFVDTMRSNNVVWGVGRGSSVASFVLYKIGVHRINSLYYNIPITEFLK